MSGPVTSEYVAVDEPCDEAGAPRRPVGAQLAVIGEQVARAPGEATERVLFQELPAIWHGGRQLVLDVRHWRRNDARFAELAADKAFAARQGMLPARIESERQKAVDEARRRWAVLIAYVAGAFVLVTVASVVGFWSWHPWRLFGPALMLVQLAVARYYRQARRLSAVLMGTSWLWVPVFLALDITDWRWWPWWVAGGLLLLACEQRGMRMARAMPEPGVPTQARAGTSFPKMWQTVRDQLAADHITAQHVHTRPLVIDGREVGVAFGMTTLEEVTDKAVGNVARLLLLGQAQVRWTLSEKNAVGELVIYFVDTLAEDRPAPDRAFGSLRYTQPFEVGRNDDGSSASLGVAYTHLLVIGDTGSGKSSVVRLVIDAVETMPDAELYGIDLAGVSLLGAQRKRLGRERVACGIEEIHAADAILDRLTAMAQRRNSGVDAGEDYDEDGVVDDRFLTDDVDDRRGIVLVIGEFTAFCRHPRLVNKLIDLGDIARKCAISIVVETPDLSKNRLEDGRAIIDIAMVTIAMACPHNDVIQALGPSKVKAGWRPDLLQPESEGSRNDAGKGYVHGGGRNLPRITKFHSMDPEQAAERRRWRRPQREAWRAQRDGAVAVDDGTEIIDAEIVTEEDVAWEAALRRALDLCGDREGLPVAELPGGLTSDEQAAVRAAAPPRTVYLASLGKPVRCVPRSALVSALHGGVSGAA